MRVCMQYYKRYEATSNIETAGTSYSKSALGNIEIKLENSRLFLSGHADPDTYTWHRNQHGGFTGKASCKLVHNIVDTHFKQVHPRVGSREPLITFSGRRVKPQGAYKFRGWTRLLDRHNTGDLHTLELWIRYKKRGEKKLYKQLLAKRVKGLKSRCTDDHAHRPISFDAHRPRGHVPLPHFVMHCVRPAISLIFFTPDSGWVHWNTAFELPTAPHGFSFVFIYFMGPKSSLDIAADDLYLAEIYQDPDWKAESDVLIDRYRKGTVRVRWARFYCRHTS